MARNDRRDDELRGGLGTLTRSQPGPRPRPREDQEQAGADVAAPAPRRGRQARGVPPQRATDGQQVTPVRRPPADAARAAGRRGTHQPGADPRGTDPRRADPRGADPRRADPRGTDPRRGDQPSADPRNAAPRRTDPRRGDQPSADPRSADPRWGGRRPRAPRNAAVLDRQGAPARTGSRPADQAPPAGAPWRVAPARRGTGPQPADPAVPEPRAFQPDAPDQAPQVTPAATAEQQAGGSHRMPFVLLLCGLLGGALVSALVISTTLAAGSFEITRLQDATSTLAKQQQSLEQQVAQAKSPEVIGERASKLGMRQAGLIQFIDLKTGKTLNDHNTGYLAHVQYPGYTP